MANENVDDDHVVLLGVFDFLLALSFPSSLSLAHVHTYVEVANENVDGGHVVIGIVRVYVHMCQKN